MDRIMRMKELTTLIGLSRPTLYEMMRDGIFPRPIQLGRRAVGWRESVINEWLETRKTA